MKYLVFVTLFTVALCKPPPYINPESIYDNLPYLVDRIQLPRDQEVTHYDTLLTQKAWPKSAVKFGQVAGVDTDNAGDIHVFHRAERSWTAESFGYGSVFKQRNLGPIKGDTLLVLDKSTGEVKSRAGANKFYMPHGIAIDHDDNTWLTDVALHQVFKFPKGSPNPSLVLGEEFVPGKDDAHFCKPTSVAVASSGEFFVADGYCNSRVMKFAPNGTLVGQFGSPKKFMEPLQNDQFLIPHSLALIESRDIICVADRENGRIQCFKAGLHNPTQFGEFVASVTDSEFSEIFAIAYDPNENLLYTVNGPNRQLQAVQGFTINADNWQVIDSWGPQRGFTNPHDIAVSRDGRHVYVSEIGPNQIWKLDRTRL